MSHGRSLGTPTLRKGYNDGEAGRTFENERKVTQRVGLGVVSL